jgi:eukaryotic-like serine/threonine-protein kinase
MPAHEMSHATVTCGNCRRELAATALFCPHCGRAKVPDDGDVLLGKILGERFLVQERIGQGASGAIYRAEHVTLRRRVAVKVLHHELSRDDLAIERFRREATTVADIDNEHIVEIHDFGRTPDGRLYLAMELLDGETLDAVLARDGSLPVDRVVDIMTQVGEALIEAHAIGYVHRDIRPRNVFLAVRRGRANFVKLLDFGLAKLVETEGGQAASTSLGMTFGDPRYMSPEQARGDAIDRRADLYQLGCVAYEMLTGAPPFTGGRVFDVLSRHVSEPPIPVSSRRPDTAPWLAAAVMQMLAKAPDDRYATMSRMVEALRLGASTGQILPPETGRRTETEPPPSVSRVMERLGRTALGPHGGAPTADEVRAAAVAAPPVFDPAGAGPAPSIDPADAAPTTTMPRVGPRGTPKVGVPILDVDVPPPAPITDKIARRDKRDSAGISSVWFADGDQLEGGAELDDSAAERLDRARRLIEPHATDSMVMDGFDPARRPIGKIAAIGAGALLLVGVLAVVVVGSSRGTASNPEPTATRSNVAVVPDAGPRPVLVDAAAAVEVAPDAGAPAGEVPPIKKPDRGDKPVRPDKGRGGDPGGGDPGGGATSAATDEDREKATFFAQTGEAQLRGGNPQGAAISFKKALELDGKNVAAITGLAEIAMSQGLYDAAIRHLKKAVKLAKNSSRIHTLLGECYLNSGNTKAAEASFKKALQIDPHNARAREGYEEASSRMPPPQDD